MVFVRVAPGIVAAWASVAEAGEKTKKRAAVAETVVEAAVAVAVALASASGAMAAGRARWEEDWPEIGPVR